MNETFGPYAGKVPAVLTTEQNDNQDILKVLHGAVTFDDDGKTYQGGWYEDSDPLYTQIIGITFRTKDYGNASEGSG